AEAVPAPLAEAVGHGMLAGRERELAELCGLVEEGRKRGHLVLLSGEAGVGKTRLVAELASLAARSERAILYGRCEPRALAPYEPFVQALRAAWPGDSANELPPAVRRYVTELLPWRPADEPARGHAAINAELEQLRLFDAVVLALDAARRSRDGLLILEDLHWAETSTLNLLSHLLAQGAPHRLTVLATVRDPDLDRGDVLAPALARIERRVRVLRLRLRGLDVRGVGALVSGWSGREAPRRLALELSEHTGGNPLLIRSTLAHLQATGFLSPAEAMPPGLPD